MHGDLDAQLVGKTLQLALPQPDARAVASSAIGGDHQPRGLRVASAADLGPPAADRLHGKRRGVVVHADADPSGVGREVVDAIRHRSAQLLDQEVMHADLLRLAPGTPCLAGVLEVAHKLLLLGVDREHRLARGQSRLDAVVDVDELRVPVWVAVAFAGLAVGLQAELLLVLSTAFRLSADRAE